MSDAKKVQTQTETPEMDPATASNVGDGPLSPRQIEELKTKAARSDEHWERLLRTTADLDNFKKRAAREKQDAIKFANASLLEKLVPVLDNFDMAMTASAKAEGASGDSLKAGIGMIYSQLKSAMTDAGLEEVDAAGQLFDPNIHEAVSQQESSEVAEGTVIQQLRKGYRFRDRLLRPATVIVSRKASS